MKHKDYIIKGLLIVCSILIIFYIILHNFIGGAGHIHEEKGPLGEACGEEITVGDAARYFSFLIYTREEMEKLKTVETIGYINLLKQAGVLETESSIEENAKLTCGEYRDMLWAISEVMDIKYKKISDELPERLRTVKEEDTLFVSEFLQVYQSLIDASEEYVKNRFQLSRLYFLTRDQEEGYELLTAQNQTTYYADTRYFSFQEHQYIEAITCDNEILIYISDIDEPVSLNNVYIISGEAQEIDAYICSVECHFTTKLPLADQVENVVGDLVIDDNTVISITVKPDIIHGKVLLTGEDEIEVEGYGTLPLDEDYRIYKVYDGLQMEKTNSILVGYDVTDFVVSEGRVCAALIKEKVRADNIRVLISTSGYESVYHDSVTFSCDDSFVVDDGNSQTEFEAGEVITVAKDSKLLSTGRIKVASTKEDGKIILKSINRGYGIPKYRGTIEIGVTQSGLNVVNELSIEEYLYAVVPSEMPVSYGAEALKVQAVCARSYAYKQLIANRYRAYGAHVDDSVNSQVYNNVEENEQSIQCVKETQGQVLTYEKQVVTAYYFSTSSGFTANVEDVWPEDKPVKYLTGSLQIDADAVVDLSQEQSFRNFINTESVAVIKENSMEPEKIETFDSGYLMYRWRVIFDLNAISQQVNRFLKREYTTKTTSIFTCVGKRSDTDLKDTGNCQVIDDMIFANKPIKSIGTIKDIRVISRAQSGIAKYIMIEGSENTVLLCYQTVIRSCFSPKDTMIMRLDGSSVSGMNLLPSAYCYFDIQKDNGGNQQLQITGGGFGHGVGMSQNGVKTLAKQGWDYARILSHYYKDTEITVIYE